MYFLLFFIAELAASVPRTEIVGKSEYLRFGMRDSLAIEASFLQVISCDPWYNSSGYFYLFLANPVGNRIHFPTLPSFNYITYFCQIGIQKYFSQRQSVKYKINRIKMQ